MNIIIIIFIKSLWHLKVNYNVLHWIIIKNFTAVLDKHRGTGPVCKWVIVFA